MAESTLFYVLSVLTSSLGLFYVFVVNSRRYKLSHIPTVGHSTPLLSYVSAWRYWKDVKYAYNAIEEGYRKYPNRLFKIPTLTSWDIIANGTKNVEEMSRAPIDVVSNSLAFADFLQLDYTLGRQVTTNPYHVTVVRTAITRNIAAQFDDMLDEVDKGFSEAFATRDAGEDAEWVEISVYSSTLYVVSRILARLSVGYPLCENEEYRELSRRAVHMLVKGRILRLFPTFLKPLASRLLINVQGDLKKMALLLEPVVRSRIEREDEYGVTVGKEWPSKPNDVLMWLMDEAAKTGIERTPLDLATRLYFLSFASEDISVTLTKTLHIIASHPADVYLNPLRAEIERVVAQEDGWTKNAVGKMYRLDSFLREVQRCFDIQPLHVSRKTLKPFIFSDGTLIPPGCMMYVNSHGMYRDDQRYRDAGKFDGFRYVVDEADIGDAEADSTGHRAREIHREDIHPTGSFKQPLLAKPALDYHAFGYGKHACPGRFSGTYQLKTMVAYVLMAYDVRLQKPGRNGNDVGDDAEELKLAGATGSGSSKSGVGVGTKLWFRRRK